MSDIRVEVVYALPERQYLRTVKLEQGSNVEQALLASGLLELRKDIDLKKNKFGIYSRPVKLADIVNDGDRIEIYRPLIADPKELRRIRAERSKNKAPLAPYFFTLKDEFVVVTSDHHTGTIYF